MILKKYGTTYQSVELNFDARAMTEIAFRRDREHSVSTDDFTATYSHVESRELTAESSGAVQDEAEVELLETLTAAIRAFEAELGPDEILLIESEKGVDYPKTTDAKKTLGQGTGSPLHFYWRVDPPLRVGRYKKAP